MAKKERGWVRMSTEWMEEGGLQTFKHPTGAGPLKTWMALHIAKGYFEEGVGASMERFPASLRELSELAHVTKTDLLEHLRDLQERKLVTRHTGQSEDLGVDPRTAAYELSGAGGRFFKLPFKVLHESNFLENVRDGSRVGLAALKAYLLIGKHRDWTHGHTMLSHLAFTAQAGIAKNDVRRAVSLLLEHGLVQLFAPKADSPVRTHRYAVTGLGSFQRESELSEASV